MKYSSLPQQDTFPSQCLFACDMCNAESHLLPNKELVLAGFRWIGHNRPSQHRNAKKGYGGVGFFIKDLILEHFNVMLSDNSHKDMLWMSLDD